MIAKLQELIDQNQQQIKDWIKEQKAKVTLPIYSSFDIRDNGVKAAVIDSNLYPGGFNNLSDEAKDKASNNFKEYIQNITDSKDVLVIPEGHTRNQHYLSNLCSIKIMLEKADYNVTLGTVREEGDIIQVEDAQCREFVLERMNNCGGSLVTKSFKKGFILLNNDFSVPAPDLLHDVKDPIHPPVKLGWTHRTKSNHFKHYCDLVKEFAKMLGFECWILCPMTEEVNEVDFKNGTNVDKVADTIDKMIKDLKEKYEEYGIKDEPYVFVKDNSGTYGMGIVSVSSGEEIKSLNSKKRAKMSVGKQRSLISSVIIQEGIQTKYKLDSGTAEPVLYSVAGSVVGGFMRIHEGRDDKESLNAPGVKFDTLLKPNITTPLKETVKEASDLGLYEVLADIATIAIGKEMEEAQ